MAPVATPSTPTSSTMALPQPGSQQPSSLSRLTLSDKLLLSQTVHHIGTSPPDWGRVSSVLLSHPLIKTKMRLEQAAKAGITLGRVFGSRECERAWVALMRQYNLVLQPGEKDPSLDNQAMTSSVEADASQTQAQLSPTTPTASSAPASAGMAQSNSSQGTAPPTTPGGTPSTPRTKEARGFPPRMDRASQLALAQFLYAERILEIQTSIKAKEVAFKAIVSEIEALQAGSLDDKLLEEIEKSTPGQEQALVEQTSKELAAVEGFIQSPPMAPAPSSTGAPVRGRISRGGSVTNLPIVSPTRPPPMPDLRLPPTTSPTTSIGKIGDVEKEPDSAKDGSAAGQQGDDEVTGSEDAIRSVEEETTEMAAPADEQPQHSAAQQDNLVAEHMPTIEESPAPEAVIELQQGIASGAAELITNKRKRGDDAETGPDSGAEEVKRARAESGLDVDVPGEVEVVAEAATGAEEAVLPIAEQLGEREAAEEAKAIAIEADEEDSTAVELTKADSADAEATSQRPEIRRSRRSARNVESDDQATPTPPNSATLKKNRVEALRSRQTSGPSVDGEEEQEAEGQEGESSRSTAEPSVRTSMSPAGSRRPRPSARRSSTAGQRKQGHRSSVNAATAHQGDETTSDVERERERAVQAAKQRKDEKVLMMLLNEVSNHTHGNLFHAPIKESDAPDYYALIRHPLDLKTIKARIKEGRITTAMQLRRALNQMFANSLIYNRPGTEVHRMAMEMRDAAELMLDQFEQTQRSAKSRR